MVRILVLAVLTVTAFPQVEHQHHPPRSADEYSRVLNDPKRDAWHQGKGEYRDLRWRGDPSHHNYSGAVRGMGMVCGMDQVWPWSTLETPAIKPVV